MYRYYYNVNSSKRVLHLYGCHYLTNSKTKEYGEKHSIEKALRDAPPVREKDSGNDKAKTKKIK